MILKPSHFEGELTIGQAASEFATTNALQWFINKYEPIFYHAIIGETLYIELVDNTEDEDEAAEPTEWDELKQRTEQLAAAFVWYFYTMDTNTSPTGCGEVSPMFESAVKKSAWPKMVKIWNELVDNMERVTNWVYQNRTKYTNFAPDIDLFMEYGMNRHENLYGI